MNSINTHDMRNTAVIMVKACLQGTSGECPTSEVDNAKIISENARSIADYCVKQFACFPQYSEDSIKLSNHRKTFLRNIINNAALCTVHYVNLSHAAECNNVDQCKV